ncbi:taperin [Centroberyx affinis]|uniref:taperin n=1 Tax=Centroberyx affinis TaxID=166261 RepID=UPI003A5BA3A2
MSGGEVRVLRQEAGQESPRMPAWKREILERRKAKGGGSGAAAGAAEACPGAGAQRVNGEVTGNGSGLKRDNGTGGGSSRNYTITTANQHFAGTRGSLASPDLSPVRANKEPWTAAADPHDAAERTEGDGPESLVLHDSLGPLQENPFIKLEKERKRRQDRENAARPVQHILELYGSVPGIRTIRAENIIIIESDPDYFPEASGIKAGSRSQQNGVSTYSSLNDLLDRRGSAVTEIRAKEVVIYDTTLSKSEENLSTLGRQDHDGRSYETGEGPGRVSRMLQKFDSNYGKLQKKSHSTENLLDLECSSSSRPRLRPKPQPDLVPKHTLHPQPGSLVCDLAPSTQPSSPVFQSPPSSKPKPQPTVSETDGPHRSAGPPQSVSSYRQRFEGSGGRGVAVDPSDEADRGQPKPTRERDWDSTEVPPKPKVPCSPETRRARAESPTSPVSFKASHSSSEFEIRPSPKPDLSLIPDGDAQARALANLRLQSRNSFTVIPKRHLAAPSTPASPAPSAPVKSPPSHRAAEVPTPGVPTSPTRTHAPTSSKRNREKLLKEEAERAARPSKPDPSPPVTTAPTPPPAPTPSPPSPVLTPAPSSPRAPSPVPSTSPAPSPVPSTSPVPSSPSPSPTPEQPAAEQLPVTNIDDIEVEPPHSVPVPSPVVQRRKGNTFTVVPKRTTVKPDSPEPPQDTSSEAQPGSTPPQAPYAQLGSLLKKRYPAVEEIEVIGGYLSLGKSCLSKTGSTGKKLKISFNESSLQSTYEYPSESSVWDSGEEDEEESGKRDGKVADEQPSMVGRIHIPRPSFTSSPTHTTNSTDLSNYIPKHSVDFNAWQEHKLDDPVYQSDANSQQTQMSEEVMLTPADSSSLSDFSSEPALYF